jgi:hypothetical protein
MMCGCFCPPAAPRGADDTTDVIIVGSGFAGVWAAVGACINPTNLWFALAYGGSMLADATADEKRRFVASLPVPLRVLGKTLGGRAYAGYRTKLCR